MASAKSRSAPQSRLAFTLIELLVVLFILALLAALLLPTLSVAKLKSKEVTCMNHLRQLTLSVQMYMADNDAKLAANNPQVSVGGLPPPDTNTWITGNMKVPVDATNRARIQSSKLFPYAAQVPLYRCPADASRSVGLPRMRSYAMNGWMGSRFMESLPGENGFKTFVKETELSTVGPNSFWLLTDEHEDTIDDGFFYVTMNDSMPFASLVSSHHQHGFAMSFADGHVEHFRILDPSTLSGAGKQYSRLSADWIRLKQLTTIRWNR